METQRHALWAALRFLCCLFSVPGSCLPGNDRASPALLGLLLYYYSPVVLP